MTGVRYTTHASLQCETHPERPENTEVLEKAPLIVEPKSDRFCLFVCWQDRKVDRF